MWFFFCFVARRNCIVCNSVFFSSYPCGLFIATSLAVIIMVLTYFDGVGVGFGFGVGCGFGVGWGFGGMPLNILGLGAGGGCGVGLGLGWGFGTAFGSQYRSSRVTFQGLEFGRNDQSHGNEFKDVTESNQKVRNSQ